MFSNVRRVAWALVLLLGMPALGFGQQLASDDFNRANGGLGANWTTILTNAPVINTNQVLDSVASDYNAALYNAVVFGNDQYSQATIKAVVNPYPGVGVRLATTSGGQGYFAFVDCGISTYYLQKFTAGLYAGSDIASGSITCTANDVIRLDVSGSAPALLTLKKNGSTVATGTDATYTSGAAGIGFFANGIPSVTDRALDDWSGGNVTAGSWHRIRRRRR